MNKYRHEYKYMINTVEENILLLRAEGILERDSHAAFDGSYCIRSLYFDDYDNNCVLDNESGADMRSKFRIRYYNDDSIHIQLEKKSKFRGMTRKESCNISQEEYNRLIQGDIPENMADLPAGKKEMFLEMKLRRLIPKIIVSYERVPFVYPAGNVRITFDKNITSSNDISRFLTRDYTVRPIMQQGYSILEVKWNEILPMYIKGIMQLDSLQWTSFSKYYMCRIYHL